MPRGDGKLPNLMHIEILHDRHLGLSQRALANYLRSTLQIWATGNIIAARNRTGRALLITVLNTMEARPSKPLPPLCPRSRDPETHAC
jgi:hypothetical protein